MKKNYLRVKDKMNELGIKNMRTASYILAISKIHESIKNKSTY